MSNHTPSLPVMLLALLIRHIKRNSWIYLGLTPLAGTILIWLIFSIVNEITIG